MPARLLTLIISSLLLLFSAGPTFAQTATTSALPSYIPQTSPAYTDLMVFNMFHTFSCLAVGGSIIGQPCLTYQVQKNAQGLMQSVPVLSKANLSGGALGTVGSILIGMYQNPPVKATDYLATVGEGLGIVKEVHAQGVSGSGNSVLSPVIALWQVSRNISYIVMIIIFVVIGLMVMFRQRINPQTVITAQTALPGLVIGLILMTFSYFIASLITDFAFLGTDLVGYYFQTAQKITPTSLTQNLNKENVLTIVSPFAGSIARGDIQHALDIAWDQIRTGNPGNSAESIIRTFTGMASYQFGQAVGPGIGFLTGGAGCIAAAPFTGGTSIAAVTLCGKIGEVIGTFVAPAAFFFTGFANPPFIISFVIAFAIIFIILYSMGKLLLRLINCYLTIVFLTITGPFHILVSALPGRQEIAIDWMRNLLCNTLSFPAVAAVIYFAGYLLGGPSSHLPGISTQLDITNTNTNLPLLGGMDLTFLRILLGFAALAALPSIPDIVCKTIGKPGAAADLFGREIQGNMSAGRGYQGQFGQKVGAVGTDIRQYKKKWYRDPYEKEGLGYQIGSMSGAVDKAQNPLPKAIDVLRGGVTTVRTGKPPQMENVKPTPKERPQR